MRTTAFLLLALALGACKSAPPPAPAPAVAADDPAATFGGCPTCQYYQSAKKIAGKLVAHKNYPEANFPLKELRAVMKNGASVVATETIVMGDGATGAEIAHTVATTQAFDAIFLESVGASGTTDTTPKSLPFKD